MTIQHVSIPDGQIHEPKGASTATSGSVYVSNGSGSGAWARINSSTLQGLSGDGGLSGKAVVTDGSGGFKLISNSAYGTMGFSNNPNSVTLSTTYVKLSGSGSPLAAGALNNITFNTNSLTVAQAGIYEAVLTVSVSGGSSDGSVTVQYKLAINDNLQNVTMKCSPIGVGYVTCSGSGLISLSAGDSVSVFSAVASAVGFGGSVNNSDLTLVLKQVG